MWTWFVTTLQNNAELAIFIALAIGYFVGPIKVAGFNLGNVTATLLAGVLVGQLNVPISAPLKSFVFLLFLFAVGYKVGPQFFAGLKRGGVKEIVLGVVYAVLGLVAAVIFSLLVHFNVGEAAGLLAGSLTQSTTVGTASDAIGRLGLSPNVAKALQDQLAIGFAVTYVLGTIVAVVVCSRLIPWLLRIDLAEESKKLAAQMGLKAELPEGFFGAYNVNSVRAVRVKGNGLSGTTVGQIEDNFAKSGYRFFVAAIHRGDAISAAKPADVISEGDVIAVAGPSEVVIPLAAQSEINDPALLGKLTLEQIDVVLTNRELDGMTVQDLLTGHARGVVLKKITRATVELPVLPMTTVETGDTLRIVGFKSSVDDAAKVIGYAIHPTPGADVVFMSSAIVIGGLLGVLSFTVGGIPISLGTGVGALLAGLLGGYLRGRSPTFGQISPGAQWAFESFALTVFIAVIGIQAGPGFFGGLKTTGLEFILGGALIPLVCLVLAAYFGRYVLRLNDVELCGALPGADTSAPALGAVQDVAKSNLVTLGYTVTYAVGNIVLTVWGAVIVAIFATKTAT